MVFGHLKLPLRAMMVATVACGLALTACSSSNEGRQHSTIDRSSLRAPAYNPLLVDGQVAENPNTRTPEGNAGLGTGSSYQLKQDPVEQEIAAYHAEMDRQYAAAPSAKAEQEFQWPWEDAPAPSLAQAPRKVPTMNQQGMASDAMLAPTTYEAIETGEVVVSDAESFVPVEGPFATPAASDDYPSLGSVPARPDRLQAVNEKADKFAELDAEYKNTTAAAQQLDAQIAYDASGTPMPLAPQPQLVQPEVAFAPSAEVTVAATAPAPVTEKDSLAGLMRSSGIYSPRISAQGGGAVGAPVASYEPVEPAQPVAEVASIAPYEAQPVAEPVIMGAPPAPLVAPQTAVTPVVTGEVVAVQENEWVDLTQGSQGAVPVEGVAVAVVPVVDSVPISPEAVALSAAAAYNGGYAIDTRNRVLPESRYAARREAVRASRQLTAPIPSNSHSSYR